MDLFEMLVREELQDARKVFPPMRNAHEAYAVILEELEEFWVWVRVKQSRRDHREMLKELVQVAAMCQRAAEDLGLTI